ncbi:HdeD family acid-resistance protein [Microlunatus sp. GCM10028923]|uniref:HdeD family acid-resistance protein n=1 Tax=Microlunatus sp. GCM10028923 TaxID=3273400 RepID=UPI003619196F
MSTEASENQVSSSPPRFGGLAIVLGVLTAVLGILVMVWPGQTLLIIALLFGLQLLFVGAFRIMVAVTTKAAPNWWRVLIGVLGGLTVIAGIICFVRPGASLLVIAILIAAGWLADGVTSIVSGVVDNWTGLHRVAQIGFGVISILAAIVVLIWPGSSLLLMTSVGGALLILLGVAIIVVALVVRSTNRPARAA